MKFLDVPQSGSTAAQTHSRNRYGQYVRSRATPVNPNSAAQSAVRSRIAANAAVWRTLTEAQRAGWASLGGQIIRTDSLGQQYTLNGPTAFASVNQNRLNAGDATLTNAPALVTPPTIATATVTLNPTTFSIAYTPSPLPANHRLFVFASPQRSAGRAFENDLRLILVSAAAASSPANVLSAYESRFGTPVTGNRIFLQLVRYVGGFTSLPLLVTQVVAS